MRIEGYRAFLRSPQAPDPDALSMRDRRLLRMLLTVVSESAVEKTASLAEGCALLWEHPQMRAELLELLDVLESRITHLPYTLETHPEVPLQVHARYSRIEILAAFGVGERL